MYAVSVPAETLLPPFTISCSSLAVCSQTRLSIVFSSGEILGVTEGEMLQCVAVSDAIPVHERLSTSRRSWADPASVRRFSGTGKTSWPVLPSNNVDVFATHAPRAEQVRSRLLEVVLVSDLVGSSKARFPVGGGREKAGRP